MILKGTERGGARQLARHLMRTDENEHVTVHQIRGFMGSTVDQALYEIYAMSRGTRCQNFMFSANLNPPEDVCASVEVFEKTADKMEEVLGLTGQPRIMVFHEKYGRRHAHVVWSKIDIENMKAVPLPFFKKNLYQIAKQTYLEHGWKMPEGFVDKERSNPLNYSLAEWQQAKRQGYDQKVVKGIIKDCWASSDDAKSFQHALQSKGFYLAQGDRRGYVITDIEGNVLSLKRALDLQNKEIQIRLGASVELPSLKTVRENISDQFVSLYKNYKTQINDKLKNKIKPLEKRKEWLVDRQKRERKKLGQYQRSRQKSENERRQSRFRKGLPAIWDWMNGTYRKICKQNKAEVNAANIRDKNEQQHLIENQHGERQRLQADFSKIREQAAGEVEELRLDFSRMVHQETMEKTENEKSNENQRDNSKGYTNDYGPEPE